VQGGRHRRAHATAPASQQAAVAPALGVATCKAQISPTGGAQPLTEAARLEEDAQPTEGSEVHSRTRDLSCCAAASRAAKPVSCLTSRPDTLTVRTDLNKGPRNETMPRANWQLTQWVTTKRRGQNGHMPSGQPGPPDAAMKTSTREIPVEACYLPRTPYLPAGTTRPGASVRSTEGSAQTLEQPPSDYFPDCQKAPPPTCIPIAKWRRRFRRRASSCRPRPALPATPAGPPGR